MGISGTRWKFLFGLGVALAGLGGSAASANAATVSEYTLGSLTGASITAGPDGAMWFTGEPAHVGRISTVDASVKDFPRPKAAFGGQLQEDITLGPDGALWFSEPGTDNIARITTNGSVSEYPVPDGAPVGVTAGPDGNVWFTEQQGVGRVAPGSGEVTRFPVAYPQCPAGITTGPDGNLWAAASDCGAVRRVTPNGAITRFDLAADPGAPNDPTAITTGPDGALWFTRPAGRTISRLTTDGAVTPFSTDLDRTAHGPYPYDVASGPDGGVWVTESEGQDIVRVTSAGPGVPFPAHVDPDGQYLWIGSPLGIAQAPNGTMWFIDHLASTIPDSSPDERYVAGCFAPRNAKGACPPATFGVGAPSGGGGRGGALPPVISSFSATPPTFAVDPKGAGERTSAARAHRGTTLRFHLSKAARVLFAAQLAEPGRRLGSNCVRPTRSNRARKTCVRYRTVARFAVASSAGSNVHRFSGRIGGRSLRAGRYRLTAIASDGAHRHSKPSTIAVRVLLR